MYKKDKCNNENINKINEYSFDFLYDYLPIKKFNYFVENQPINFKDNKILFIIYIYIIIYLNIWLKSNQKVNQ